ncbi:MAG: methyltransferase domain-containing protein [Bacteroidota bacterium]|nr:methyltransferase domain-containing protein [Bacteroidota bacterium]
MQQNSFDTYSRVYDEDFTFSPIGKMQRARVHYFLNKKLIGIKKALEINCGTGEDAKWLASKGILVTASDISGGMIEVCKSKGISGVDFLECDSRKISSTLNDKKFDLIFSNFGGLNCLDSKEIQQFLFDSLSLLNANGILAAVIMGRKCGWERMYFKRKKDPRLNRRYSKTGTETIIDGQKFLTHYYTPEEFYNSGKECFNLLTCKPIGLFVPPSYFNRYFKNKSSLLNMLYGFEKLSPFSFLANRADHYLIILQKKTVNAS